MAMSTSVSTFASRLRVVMLRRGLTAAELARRAEVSESAISLLLAGRRAPSLDVARRVARALDVSIDSLAG